MVKHNAMLDQAKRFLKTPLGLFVGVALFAIVAFTLIIKVLSGHESSKGVAETMQASQSSQVSPNLHYTTEETLSTLTGETDNIQQGLSTVESQVGQFKKDQNQKTQAAIDAMQQELVKIKAENAQMQQAMLQTVQQRLAEEQQNSGDNGANAYRVGGSEQGTGRHGLVWFKDQAHGATAKSLGQSQAAASFGQAAGSPPLLGNGGQPLSKPKPKPIPVFTIPANTLLTGVTPEQPLVGMIPVDGTVVNPQSVLFMVGANNLAANNWRLPPNLKGIQGNAVCEGVFVWFNDAYANCTIQSLTFIFQDGRIATETARHAQNFGHLTTLYGSPNIPGTYHGNALYAGMGTGAFAGLQGFGNAYASQQQQFSSLGNQIAVSYKNAFDAGAGSAMGSTGQYLNEWWQALLKSTTDFVFVPNWDPLTHKILQLNAVITKPVNIDYNPVGRKVSYEDFKQASFSNSLN